MKKLKDLNKKVKRDGDFVLIDGREYQVDEGYIPTHAASGMVLISYVTYDGIQYIV